MHPNYDFEHLAMFYFRIFTSTVEMKRLKSGFLLKEILNRFTNKTQQTLSPDRFLWMYFAHDNTIANMLNSLGLYKVLNFRGNDLFKMFIVISFYSCINHRMHRAFSSNCTTEMENRMCKFSIETQQKFRIHQH